MLGLDGREVGPAAIQVLKREAGKPARLVANVTPPKLSPGEYRLEVKLSRGGRDAHQLDAVRRARQLRPVVIGAPAHRRRSRGACHRRVRGRRAAGTHAGC